MHGGQTVVAEFEDQDAAWFEMRGGLRNELGVKFVAFFAAVECDFRFVVANFAHERSGFASADVGRITHDEVKERRHIAQKISFQETHTVCNFVTRSVTARDG